MKRLFICFFALFWALLSQAKTVIPVATDAAFPPYSYLQHKKAAGIYVEMIEQINQAMPDFEIALHPFIWSTAKNKMRSGEMPALMGAYYHGHDWDYLYPYSQPLWYEDVIVVCHQEKVNKTGLNWPLDFEGKLISHINGYDGWLKNNVRAKALTDIINFIEVPDITTAWRMASRQIVDCTLFEQRAMDALKEELGEAEKMVVASHISTESVHIGFSNHSSVKEKWPNIAEFRKQLDDAIYLTIEQRRVSIQSLTQ